MNPLLLRGIRASAGAVPPYLAGGAPMPAAVYNPMGASSLAESYLRIAGTGGHANLDPAVVGAGVAPTHAPGVGWDLRGGNKWLDTGIFLPEGSAAIARYSDFTTGSIFGTFDGVRRFSVNPGGVFYYYADIFWTRSPSINAGTIGLAGNQGYRSGSPDGAPGAASWSGGSMTTSFKIGRADGISFAEVVVQYLIIWDTSIGHAAWMPAASAAVAAL